MFTTDKATVTDGIVFETLCAQLDRLISFQRYERDILLLQHRFVVEWADGKEEK